MLGFWAALVIFAVWAWKGGEILAGTLFFMPSLEKYEPPRGALPRVSVIFAFRDEPRVGTALRSMLELDYPDLEVIAVNDRSREALVRPVRAERSPRLKVVDVSELEAGWLGKLHAVSKGYEASSGEWLVFTDADVVFEPDTLRRAFGLIERERLDHLVLFPRMILEGFWENLYVPVFVISFWMRFRPWMARFRRSKAYIGVGAFNMVRRAAYERIGTHAAFRLEIADDLALGKFVKEAGYRQMACSGERHISVRWAEGFRGIVASIRKNAFAGMHYNLAFAAVSLAGLLVLNFGPYAAAVWGEGAARALGLGALGILFVIYCGFAARNGPKCLLYFLFYPIGVLLLFGIVLNSAFSILRRGGVEWRGTFYPLDELRRHHKI